MCTTSPERVLHGTETWERTQTCLGSMETSNLRFPKIKATKADETTTKQERSIDI